MRIAVTFPGCHRRGGVERVMLEAVNFLAGRDHEVHAYADEFEVAGMDARVCRHDVRSRPLLACTRLPAFLRASEAALRQLRPKPDVVAGFGAASLPGSAVWMQSVHAAWLAESRQRRGLQGRLRQRLNPFHPIILGLEKRLLAERRYRKIIALTERVKADLQEHYDVPSADIAIVPNGYSPSEFNRAGAAQKREQMRAQLGYAPEDQVVLFVANELERKGFFPLLRALASFDNKSVHLLAVGRLPQRDCRSNIQAMGITSQVRFTGPTPRVADYFAAADVFALPTFYEAWGLVIVEALACGVPVLTSRLAGAAVAVCEGRNGFLLEDPANAEELGEKLRALLAGRHDPPEQISRSVARFQWTEILPAYEMLLEDCCA